MGWGFADTVRKQLQALGAGGREVTNAELAEALDLVGDKDKRPMYRVLADMRKSGEVLRIRPGCYVYVPPKKNPEIREKMWRILRARRTVTVDDLVELAGASQVYAREWLQTLERREIVRRIEGQPVKYRMISDPVEMPKDEEKAKRLRKLRRRKKREALAALEAAELAIQKAKEVIHDYE